MILACNAAQGSEILTSTARMSVQKLCPFRQKGPEGWATFGPALPLSTVDMASGCRIRPNFAVGGERNCRSIRPSYPPFF